MKVGLKGRKYAPVSWYRLFYVVIITFKNMHQIYFSTKLTKTQILFQNWLILKVESNLIHETDHKYMRKSREKDGWRHQISKLPCPPPPQTQLKPHPRPSIKLFVPLTKPPGGQITILCFQTNHTKYVRGGYSQNFTSPSLSENIGIVVIK